MADEARPERYWISKRPFPLWSLLVLVCVLFAWPLFGAAAGLYEPPDGWVDFVAAVPIGVGFFSFMFWFANKMGTQYIDVRNDGLLIALPFGRTIAFGDLSFVRSVEFSKPLGEWGWRTFFKRKVIPAWDRAPNVEIGFRQPVRLNLYPFNWFKLPQLTLDRPDEFVASIAARVK